MGSFKIVVVLIVICGFALLCMPQNSSGEILFALDQSGSMTKNLIAADSALPSNSKTEIAKKHLQEIVSAMSDSQTLGLVTFPAQCSQGNCDINVAVPLGSQQQDKVVSQLRSLSTPYSCSANRPLAKVVEFACQESTKRHTHIDLVIITDGADTCSGNPEQMVSKWVARKADISIHIVGLSVPAGIKGKFKRLAEASSGNYYHISNTEGLKFALKEAVGKTIIGEMPYPRRPTTDSTITYEFQNSCGGIILVNFRSQDYKEFSWPKHDWGYTLEKDGKTHTFVLSCTKGEKICWGANKKSGFSYWGAGQNCEHDCTKCTDICGESDKPIEHNLICE